MKITDVILQEDTDYEKYIRQNLAAMAKDAHKKDYWGVNEILSHVLNYKGDPDQEIMRQSQNLDLLNTYKAAIIKSLLIVIKMPEDEFDEYEYDFNNVINFLKSNLKWPEIDVITKAIAYNNEKKSVNESEESDELVAEFLGYIDQKNYWEAFNSLISAYDADRDCLQSWWAAFDDEKPAIMKGLLSAIKNESDLPLESIIADMYADLQWPELVTVQKAMMYNKQQKAVGEAYDPDSDPVIGYVQNMYKDLSDGATDLTVLNLRDYIYDTGSPENLARSILEIEPRLPALIQQHRHGIIKSMLEMVKKDYEYAGKVLFPVFEVLQHLGIRWPECDRITAALSQGGKQESVTENAEQFPATEILKYVKQIHPEGEFNIDHVITDHPFWTQDVVPLSSVHIFDPEQDDIYDPYNRVQDTNLHHVDKITPIISKILDSKPIVIDHEGYVLDGNHRALAARNAGLQSVPVLRPVKAVSEVKQRLDAKCWTGKHKAGTKIKNGVRVNNCVPNESVAEAWSKKYKRSIDCSHPKGFSQKAHCAGRKKKANEQQAQTCPHCGGIMYEASMMTEKKDACYYKVKSRYKVWPSAYASGALVKCRKKGAKNWGSKSESAELPENEYMSEDLRKWFKEKWVRFGPDGKIRGDCARGSDKEGKPKCLPQSKAHSLGKKGRASAAARKRRQDPNADRSGKAINVKTKKESVAEDLSVNNAPRVPAYVQSMEKKLSANMRNLFQFVIDLAYEDRMSDPGFRSQVLTVFEKIKPELVKYMLHNIKHSDSDNVKWLAPAMIRMGLNWPELQTINQALNAKRPDRAVTENDYRFSDVHQKKAEEDADRMNDSLEKLGKHIAAGGKITVREITSFWDVIYDINVFSKYRLAVLQPVLEHHKKTIVYMMLYILKHHHDDINEPMPEIFTSLRHARINWPELKTIQQALAQGSKTESVSEAFGSAMTLQALRTRMNKLMNDDQKYTDPTQRTNWQDGVWRFINSNQAAIFADKGNTGNGDYPAAPYAAWLLVQHMDAHPERQSQFYMKLRKAFPNHPKLQFLKDRSAVNAWILKNANNPEYYHDGKPLPNPTVNVRNPAMFRDAAVKAKSREEALTNAEQAGNKLLVAAVNATNAQTQPSYTQQNESVEEADDYGKFKTISDMISRDYAEHPVRGFYMMLYHLNELELTVADMPEIKPLIDRVKPDVIRALLQSVKADNDGMNISNALQILDRMQKCGVNWPEIDKIRQGLQHNRQQTTEGIDEIESDRLKSFVKQIQQPLASKTGWLAAQTLEDLAGVAISKSYSDNHFTDSDYAEAAAVLNLNNHKDVLIKGILENIKQNIANGNSTTWLAENVAMQKQILKKLGCNWPELDRIAAAVAHNAN